jgi:hypothetical protein
MPDAPVGELRAPNGEHAPRTAEVLERATNFDELLRGLDDAATGI